LMGLIIYIYALLGMSFFGHLEFNQGPNELYNRHANFNTFYVSCITLFRMATGESWNGIMHDCMQVYWWSWLYFTSFVVFGAYMILNLLIAIILETFSRVMKQEDMPVKPIHITNFLDIWTAFDPESFSFIDASDLKNFLRKVDEPLWPASEGMGATASLADITALIARIPVTGEGSDAKVHLVELFVALMKEAYGRGSIEQIEPKALKRVVADVVSLYPTIYRNDLSVFDKGRDKGSEVQRALEAMRINPTSATAYASLMVEHGVDTLADLTELTKADLDMFGMKTIHKNKVWNVIRQMRVQKKNDVAALIVTKEADITPQARVLWTAVKECTDTRGTLVMSNLAKTTRIDLHRTIMKVEEDEVHAIIREQADEERARTQ